jgi:hypothetical protein
LAIINTQSGEVRATLLSSCSPSYEQEKLLFGWLEGVVWGSHFQ